MNQTSQFEMALLIPCLNASRYLPDLFASVNAQTIPFKEIICYDDASTDNTAAVAASLGAKVIRGQINRGAAYARNRLLEATTCEWVHFHDADDLIDPLFVEIMTQNIAQYEISILCGIYILDLETRLSKEPPVSFESLNYTNDFVAYFLKNMSYAINGVYPRKVLQDINCFREDLRGNEDPDLHVRLAMAGHRFYGEKRALVTCLEHVHSFSSSNNERCLLDRFTCYSDYARILDRKYSPILGKEILSIAGGLYGHGCIHEAKEAIRLANKLGVKNYYHKRLVSRLISRMFGIKGFLCIKSSYLRYKIYFVSKLRES